MGEFPAKQRRGNALLPHSGFPVHRPGGLSRGSRGFQEAAGNQHPHEGEQRRDKHGHNDTRFGISRADAAKQINGVGAILDGGAVDRQIGKQLLNQRHCPEIEEIVRTEKRQRNDDGHKALMLQQADLRDHPA